MPTCGDKFYLTRLYDEFLGKDDDSLLISKPFILARFQTMASSIKLNMTSKLKEITIYTDGSCLNNPGNGGWGAILIYNKKEKELSGSQAKTTNNQMELKAVIEGIKTLKEKCKINLFTDSKYVQQGITSWIHNWQKQLEISK